MNKKVNRREFIRAGLAAGVAARAAVAHSAPVVITPQTVKPVVISDRSGIAFKNGGPQCTVEKAFELITKGEDVLDALIAGVNINSACCVNVNAIYGCIGRGNYNLTGGIGSGDNDCRVRSFRGGKVDGPVG